MLLGLLLLFGVALATPRFAKNATGRAVPALLGAAAFLFFAVRTPDVLAGGAFTESWPWIPGLGIELAFRLDGLALLFCLLVTGIGAGVLLYSVRYLADRPDLPRFLALLLAFIASMLGLVLADDLICLFLFWELTSVTSYLLVGFEHEEKKSRDAALRALLVTSLGGLVLLAGLLLLAEAAGSFRISTLAGRDAHSQVALLLVLIGAFTKSAQFPFHFWLPDAMAAPTPASALLHSSTMVKAGVYLVARLHPFASASPAWTSTLTAVGAVTTVLGALLALRETNLKRMLAYTTVSALGTLMLMFGIGTGAAVGAALVFLLAHALYKASLFLVAGSIGHETGTFESTDLGGLRRGMPWTAATGVLAALSMAGAPPLLGFIAKESLFKASLPLAAVPTVAAAAGIAAVAGLVGIRPFVGARSRTTVHDPAAGMWVPAGVLALLGLALAVVPSPARPLLDAAATSVFGEPTHVDVALWHGWTLPLGLSMGVLLAGAAVCVAADRFRGVLARIPGWNLGPARVYAAALPALAALASATTKRVQTGYLRRYVLVVLAVAGSLFVAALCIDRPSLATDHRAPRVHELLVAALVLAAIVTAVRARTRLAAVAALGLVGYGVALFFVFLGAPDLAMTQFVIETLLVIIFVLVFRRLPPYPVRSRHPARIRDLAVSLGFGAAITILVLVASGYERPSVSAEHVRRSVGEAHGRNVVNVTLVDFRALDTLGEITVLVAAAVGVVALLRLPHLEDPS